MDNDTPAMSSYHAGTCFLGIIGIANEVQVSHSYVRFMPVRKIHP